MPPIKAEDFIVDGLTADEIAALKEGQADDAADAGADAGAAGAAGDVDATAKAAADKEAADKAAADKTASDKAAADAAAKATADATAQPAKDKPAAEAAAKPETTAPAAQPSTVPNWQAPKDAEAKLTAINTARDALAEKFDAGELSAKDLLTQQRNLDRQERDIERLQDRASMAKEMTQATWLQRDVPAFLDANPRYRDNTMFNTLLDTEVRRLQVEAGEKGGNPLDPAILVQADANIKASLGEQPAGAKPAPAKPALGAKLPLPPTLANVPAADITDTDSKWAALDRLSENDSAAYEDAYAKLSPADRDTYLARG